MDTSLVALAVTWEPMIFLGLPLMILIAGIVIAVVVVTNASRRRQVIDRPDAGDRNIGYEERER